MKALAIQLQCELVREIPGRMRLTVAHMRRDRAMANFVQKHLQEHLSCDTIRADAATGRVLICYEPRLANYAGFINEVRARVDEAVVAYIQHRRKERHLPYEGETQTLHQSELLQSAASKSKEEKLLPFKAILGDDKEHGLTSEEVKQRLAIHGLNVLPKQHKPTVWRVLWMQISDWMSLTLVGVAVVSLLTGRAFDALTITAVLAVNSVVGILQERRVSQEVEALKSMTSYAATVIRDGIAQVVPASEVVIGDLVLLEAGDRVPADGVILQAVGLEVDESLLTGESQPTPKIEQGAVELDLLAQNSLFDATYAVFMGTGVTRGKGKMLVTATGAATQMGKLAASLSTVEVQQTVLQERIHSFGRMLVAGILATVAAVIVVGLWRGLPLTHLLLTAMALAASAIPEGLPLLITIGLTAGVRRVGKTSLVIRKLSSLETLGRVTVICSDKTGTLTKNEMTVRQLWTSCGRYRVSGDGYDPRGEISFLGADPGVSDHGVVQTLARLGGLCNDAELCYRGKPLTSYSGMSVETTDATQFSVRGDPTDGALLVMALKAGCDLSEITQAQRMHEWVFTPEQKRMSVVYAKEGQFEFIAKGAVEEILVRSSALLTEAGVKPLTLALRTKIIDEMSTFAAQAMRVMAVAYRPLATAEQELLSQVDQEGSVRERLERDLIFVGLVGMVDPLRAHVEESIQLCREANIRVLMITGDHPVTAAAVAREIGLVAGEEEPLVLTGAEVENMSIQQLAHEVEKVSIFARMSPQHKLAIVDALKLRKQVVAMTGDGVNDAPAVRRADVGIAMGRRSTEVTREASVMTVADENFSTIVSGVKEGRDVLGNILRALGYLLSGNLGEVLYAAFAVFLGMPLPFVPVQILLINLLTDAAPTIGLVTRPPHTPAASRQALTQQRDFLDKQYVRQIFTHAVAIGFSTLGVFALGLKISGRLAIAQTMAMVTLSLAELLHIESWHHDEEPAPLPVPSDRVLRVTFYGSLLMIAGSLYLAPLQHIFQTTALPIFYLTISVAGAFGAYAVQTAFRTRGYGRVGRRAKALTASAGIVA
ncbi:cation-translocating P-type ATPase [Sulfoacidibacillus thermotolerans]|nr:cation-translocating P-type ATPase [Sulfoacidibacillus thermotolerans]